MITAWDVVEHSTDTSGGGGTLAKHLVPGGILAFSTPLRAGIHAKVLGAHYPMPTPPESLSIPSRKSLKILAKKFLLRKLISALSAIFLCYRSLPVFVDACLGMICSRRASL